MDPDHTPDTDAPHARLVGHFKNTWATGPAHMFSQRLIEMSWYVWYHGDLPVWINHQSQEEYRCACTPQV